MIPIVVLAGPTASGKSRLALELACELDGEIVGADSMQLYRELGIGVAKPSPADRAAVPHHLLDAASIRERMSVHRYCELADCAIEDIHGRGRLPIVAGGTGLYIKALLYGLDDLPGDPALRARLDAEYDGAENLAALKQKMHSLDPAAAEKFAGCQRKLIRALEVKLLTGQSILQLQSGQLDRLRYRVFGRYLSWEREELKQRIRNRVEAMLHAGWIEECRELLKAGLLATPTAHQALGYNIIADFLKNPGDRQELVNRISTATWQFARRQQTWMKHQMPESRPLPMPCRSDDLVRDIRAWLAAR